MSKKKHYAEYLDIGRPIQIMISDLEVIKDRIIKAENDLRDYKTERYKKEQEIKNILEENFTPEELLDAQIKDLKAVHDPS